MVSQSSTQTEWIVVEVHSGIPVDAKAFMYQQQAIKYLELVRKDLNPDNDEAEIFEIKLPLV
jgi:hypothetical protein